jgi:hypothetical protein
MTDSLRDRLSEGTINRRRVAIAAALGCDAAISTGIEPAALDDHYRTRIKQIAAYLSQRQCLAFGFECAGRALRVWEDMFPADLRPRRAVEAARAWLTDNDARADFNALCYAAEQSHIDVDYPELTEDVDPGLVAAMEATSACSHIALAVQYAIDHEEHSKMCGVTAWIARFGVKSAADRQRETELQTSRLVALLLE